MTADKKLWQNVNLYPTLDGQMVSNVNVNSGYTLNAIVLNNGTETQYNVTVEFYIFPSGSSFLWPSSPYGTGTIASLNSNTSVCITCSNVWTPSASGGTHQCLVAVVYSDACSSPVVVGSKIDLTNAQVAQHNEQVVITKAANAARSSSTQASSLFNVEKTTTNGHVIVKRGKLVDSKSVLELRGVNPYLQETASTETINIIDKKDGKSHGAKMHLKAGKSYKLEIQVSFQGVDTDGSTGALYYVEEYEGDTLVGGISMIVVL